MRSFNTSGPNIPAQHYTLSRLDLLEKGKKLVYDERYFTIWAPRQTGKSTYFSFLAQVLEAEGYRVAYLNFENYRSADLESFISTLVLNLEKNWDIDLSNLSLVGIFDKISQKNDEKWVLIIDEVEGINPEYFGDFLHSIRNVYHSRQHHCLKSVILVGVSNIVGVVRDNASPFNISENLNVPYFSTTESFELLAQHETETGQFFEEKVKEKIAEITANQPGLVNGFAGKLVENCVGKKIITYTDYLVVEDWYLTKTLDKNVSNIINKARKHQNFVETLLFSDSKIPFQIYKDPIKELYVNGVINYDTENNVIFDVPLYQKCLYMAFSPYTNGEKDRISGNVEVETYFTEGGVLALEKIIEEYKVYALRRGFRYFRERDASGRYVSIKEAALVYSFDTYLNAILSVINGKSYLEAHAGLGRTDLIINANDHEFIVETKVYRDITQFNKGKKQLASYTKKLNLTIGYYIVFVSSEITHSKVLEAVEDFEGVTVKTYLVRYDLEKDFE